MGDALPAVQAGLTLACPSTLGVTVVEEAANGGDGLGQMWTVVVSLAGAAAGVFLLGALCLCYRHRVARQQEALLKEVRGEDGNRE